MGSDEAHDSEPGLQRLNRKFRDALYGVAELDTYPNWLDDDRIYNLGELAGKVTRVSTTNPPSYVAHLVLRVAGFTFFRREDKSVWQASVQFEGKEFWVRDRKRSTLVIEGPPDDNPDTERHAKTLLKKLRRAAQLLDRELEAYAKEAVQKGEFILNNNYHQVYPLYEFFRDRALELTGDPPESMDHSIQIESTGPPVEVGPEEGPKFKATPVEIPSLSQALENMANASKYAAAAVAFFYSYVELLLDVLYAFETNRPWDFEEFRYKRWATRCTELLPLDTDKELNKAYEEIHQIKKSLRDVLLHGFAGDEGMLVHYPGLGLAPTSYDHLNTAPHYSRPTIPPDEVDRVLGAFGVFETALRNNQETALAVEYARSGLEIPFGGKPLADLQSHLGSVEKLREYVEDEHRRRDYHSDQY